MHYTITGGDFTPLETINTLEMTTASTFDSMHFMKRFQQELKDAMDLVMKKTSKMVDHKIEAMVREQEKTRSLYEFNFKAKLNELRRDIQ